MLVLGLIATVVFGIQALRESESLSILGVDIVVSEADWTPLIISALVLIAGIILTAISKK